MKMKKYIVLFLALVLSQFLFSQSENVPAKKTQKAFAKIDFLSIQMPETNILNEPNMGFAGIHYNFHINKNFYTGAGIYGSVTGKRGGFFTLGMNLGYKKNLSTKFYLDTGFHFGGGGGAGAPDGGGAFILPHFNLGYDFKSFSINSGWSYVNFFDGGLIKGHQINLGLEIPIDFNYTNTNELEEVFSLEKLNSSNWKQKTKKSSLMFHLNNLKVLDAPPTEDQVIKGKTIRLAGFEFARYFSENWFSFLKVDGAYSGIRAGYMDVFLGLGYHFSFNKNRTNIIGKFGLGAGGGGGVDSDGGFLLSPDISIEQQIFKDIYISINKGFLFTPSQIFKTSNFGIGLKYYVDINGTSSNSKTFNKGTFKDIDLIIKQDWYFNAKRMTEPTEDMHQISLQINYNLNKNIFLAGQTSFANFGNAGAYAEGIVGLGIKTDPLLNKTITIFTQVLGGAAGGGNISTGEGLIIKPSMGFDYKLNKTLNFRSSIGYVKSKGGELSSTYINFGIKYNLSFLKMN
tara:strand:+ start:3325 stop:4866 length:1542 start_codon:yes stop_codon:yes gene_type:complete